MLAENKGAMELDSGRLAAAEKTLQKMEHEIKLAESVALTQPVGECLSSASVPVSGGNICKLWWCLAPRSAWERKGRG